MPIVLHCHKGIGPAVTGEALVADDNFSARYDLDRIRGIFSRPTHKLAGQNYVGKILVLDTAKGGVASAWMLHEMRSRGMAPRASRSHHTRQRARDDLRPRPLGLRRHRSVRRRSLAVRVPRTRPRNGRRTHPYLTKSC